MQHDSIWQRAVLCEDTQQGVGQVPCQEIQQDGAVHCVSSTFLFAVMFILFALLSF